MYELALDLGAELLVVAIYALGTVALSLLGLVAEYNGLRRFLGGDQLLAVWYAYVGVVALAFAVNLAREKLLPAVTVRR